MLTIRPANIVSAYAPDILEAACNLLSATLSSDILAEENTAKLVATYLDTGAKRRETGCQEAVAILYGRLSDLRNPSKDVAK